MRGVRTRRGFTLVELLVILAAALLLAVVVIPSFQRTTECTFENACASNLNQLAIGLKLYEMDQHAYPGEAAVAGRPVDAAAMKAWVDNAEQASFLAAGDATANGNRSGMLVAWATLLETTGMRDPGLLECPGSPNPLPRRIDFDRKTLFDDGTSTLGWDRVSYSLGFGVAAGRSAPGRVIAGDRVRYGTGAAVGLDLAPGPDDPGAPAATVDNTAQDPAAHEGRGVNHGGSGFALLRADGSVKFTKNPSRDPAVMALPDAPDPRDNLFTVVPADDPSSDRDTGLF